MSDLTVECSLALSLSAVTLSNSRKWKMLNSQNRLSWLFLI